MVLPSFSTRFVAAQLIQSSARIRFEIIHDFLGQDLRFNNRMDVVGSRVHSQQAPPSMQTNVMGSIQNRRSPNFIERIRGLVHPLAFCSDTLRVNFQQPATGQIPGSIYRAAFVAVQVSSITREGNEISQSE